MSDRKSDREAALQSSTSRRAFLKSATLGGALLTGGLLAACSNQPAQPASSSSSQSASAPSSGQSAPAAQPTSATEDVLQKIIRTKQLNVAVVIYPPLTIKKDGQLTGGFVDAANWLGQQMEAKVSFIEAEFGTFIAALQSGRADVAMSASYSTVPRALAVDFTRSIMWIGYSALVRKADAAKWKSVEEADKGGARFVEVEGTAVHKILAQGLTNAKMTAMAPGTNPANLALEVMGNRADIYVEDDFIIKDLVSQHKDQLAEVVAYTEKPWRMNSVAWAVNKGQTSMLNVLNVAIDNLTDNGMWQQWDAKYGAHWLYKKDAFVQGVKS